MTICIIGLEQVKCALMSNPNIKYMCTERLFYRMVYKFRLFLISRYQRFSRLETHQSGNPTRIRVTRKPRSESWISAIASGSRHSKTGASASRIRSWPSSLDMSIDPLHQFNVPDTFVQFGHVHGSPGSKISIHSNPDRSGHFHGFPGVLARWLMFSFIIPFTVPH